jgi:hypothetical protein
MIGAQYFFMSFTVSNSIMYEEIGRRTRHVVQGYRVVVFQMESGSVL